MKGYWTCQRQSGGVKCRTRNANRYRKCLVCDKRRPPRSRPKHMAALDASYEEFVVLNGGEHCAICRRGPASKRLDRDHCHATGRPRGLLCSRCNRALPNWMTADWLETAAAYLRADAVRMKGIEDDAA
jgi:hypothetical protein